MRLVFVDICLFFLLFFSGIFWVHCHTHFLLRSLFLRDIARRLVSVYSSVEFTLVVCSLCWSQRAVTKFLKGQS